MTVYIVLRNDTVDRVFSTPAAAEEHAKSLNLKWALTKIIEKVVL